MIIKSLIKVIDLKIYLKLKLILNEIHLKTFQLLLMYYDVESRKTVFFQKFKRITGC